MYRKIGQLKVELAQPICGCCGEDIYLEALGMTPKAYCPDILNTGGIDSKGRVFGDSFIEQVWGTVEYEEINLHNFSLGNLTPQDVYFKIRKAMSYQ